MAVFAYDPVAVNTWATSVLNYLNGGTESIKLCSEKFIQQIEKLVMPNVWTGPAASKNYNDFLITHEALINFVNNFGQTFETAITSINANVSSLEVTNAAGTSNSVSASFGTVDFTNLNALSQINITQDVVRYDYAVISSIGQELNNIFISLQSIDESLKSKICELNNQSGIWDGNAADSAKENLLSTVSVNMSAIMDALNVCIQNISLAAENAQAADTAM